MLTMPSLEKFFKEYPAGKAFVADAEAGIESQRAEARAIVAKARKEFDKTYPGAKAEFVKARDKVLAAQKALESAIQEERVAWANQNNAYQRNESARSVQLCKLKTDLADERIDQFAADVRKAIDQHRAAGPQRLEGKIYVGRLGGSHNAAVSNSTAFRARLGALVALLGTTIDGLYLSSDLQGDIAKAWASLPECDGVWDDLDIAQQIEAFDKSLLESANGTFTSAKNKLQEMFS